MSVDMSQFYQVFFEEAVEHLSNMEQMLLDIDLEAIDDEEMNAIFRAAHSIKGSAGTFGFTDLAQVTHELETLLDRIRKHEMHMTPEMVDASLEAGDLLRDLLSAHRGEGQSDASRIETVCARLKALYLSGDAAQSVTAELTPAATPVQGLCRFRFALPGQGEEAKALLDNLKQEIQTLGFSVEALQDSGESWELTLLGPACDDAVREVIEFVCVPGSFAALAEKACGTDEDYGFFDAVPAPPAQVMQDESYGLFADPEPATVVASASDDPAGSYGFFDEAQPGGSIAATSVPDDPAGGYGFFQKVAAPAPDTGTSSAKVVDIKPATPVVTPPARASKPAGGDSSIRVSVEKVDQIINLVGELVITQAMLASAAEKLDPVEFERLMSGVQQLERNTRDLQESVMSIRMLPMSVVFSRFPRVVRDLSQKLGKQVRLVLAGESTELDKNLIERITDPLTHLIRNSLDHGIETPETRLARGKPAEGTITLKASHQSGNIVIEVGDDGAGLNRERILSKARERGLAVSEGMSDQDVWALIFEPGFSTADQVTEVSGRGVGMDVVKKNIAAMGGRVDIESLTGVGTRMTVRLPLTLAILDGMSVQVGSETYIIPLNYVVESLQPTPAMIKSVGGAPRLVQVRNEYLNILTLHDVFSLDGTRTELEQGILVVLESDGDKIALFVNELVGQHQVVIKSLEANYRRVQGISGATIMGDGRVGLILDVPALVNAARATLPAAA